MTATVGAEASSLLDAKVSLEMARGFLERMMLLRAFDERVGSLCRQKALPGLIHLGIGEEAVAVGACGALARHDKVTSTHRAHGHFLAKGGSPRALMAELFGKTTGCCRGKGGSMHLVDLEVGFLGANGVVGAGLPLAVGSAIGRNVLDADFVTLCFFGDGANNNGAFHESLNLASVMDLPVVFLCENNEYGISIALKDQQRVANVADRGPSYAMPSHIVDGNDVLAVYGAVRDAVRHANAGDGPTLIECKTYRTTGHYEGDSQSYRSKDEVRAWKAKDPIERLTKRLIEAGALDDAKAKAMREHAAALCDDAVEFAMRSPDPDPEEAFAHVYHEEATA